MIYAIEARIFQRAKHVAADAVVLQIDNLAGLEGAESQGMNCTDKVNAHAVIVELDYAADAQIRDPRIQQAGGVLRRHPMIAQCDQVFGWQLAPSRLAHLP